MRKNARSNELLALQRKQLDARLNNATDLRSHKSPRGGWIKSIRTALGMSSTQLGKRLKMTSQGALDLERRERDESITIAKLRETAEALNCDVVVTLVPKTSLEETVQQKAREKALEERNRIVHTMRLEAQHSGVEDALDTTKSQQDWLTTKLSRLWD